MVDQNASGIRHEDDGNYNDPAAPKRFDRLSNPIIKVNRALLKDEASNKPNKRERKEDKKKTFRVTFVDKVE